MTAALVATWSAILGLALAGLLLVAEVAGGEARTRVDFFDVNGQRTGYAVVDRGTGRIDFYDVNSRRTGYGRVDATGRAERFTLGGTRGAETAIPRLRREK